MTDENQGQDPSVNSDATAADDGTVPDNDQEPQEEGQQLASDPTPDTGQAATVPYGSEGETVQEGTPDAEAPDPAGIEPDGLQSVPTTRGPGSEDTGDGGTA